MALRDNLIPVVDSARQIVADLGFRRVEVVVRSIAGADDGLAALASDADDGTATDLTLDPPPRVSDWVVRGPDPAGLYQEGDQLVTRISATYTEAELNPGGNSVWLLDDVEHALIKLLPQSRPGSKVFLGWSAVVRPMRRRA